MTTVYKFKAYYTDSGVGAVQDPAPTCTVINMADDSKLADAQATTASTNMPGLYSYEYSGADGLDVVACFKTSDPGCDVKELASYVSEKITTNLNADVAGVETKVDTIYAEMADVSDITTPLAAIDAKTTNLPASPAPADEYDADFTQVVELLYSIMGGEGWTDETLVSIQAAIEAISSIDEAGVRNAIGLAAANLDTQLTSIPKGTTVYDGKTLTELIKLVSAVLLGKLSGGGTGQLAFRDIADTKDRVITDVDLATGDRTTQTLDGA